MWQCLDDKFFRGHLTLLVFFSKQDKLLFILYAYNSSALFTWTDWPKPDKVPYHFNLPLTEEIQMPIHKVFTRSSQIK